MGKWEELWSREQSPGLRCSESPELLDTSPLPPSHDPTQPTQAYGLQFFLNFWLLSSFLIQFYLNGASLIPKHLSPEKKLSRQH